MKKRMEINEFVCLSEFSYGRTDQPWRIQRSIGMKHAVHGWLSTYERLVKSQNFFSSYLTQEDLSRLGRNYIEVGKLTEEFFPLHDVRLVAVSDGVDSDEGEDDFTPFKNIMKNISCLGRVFC